MKKLIMTIMLMGSLFMSTISNAFLFYPSHSCNKPSPPYKPYSFSSNFEIDNYNRKVADYNSDRETYINCINDYLRTAKEDIEEIQDSMQNAINEVNY